MVFSSPIFLFLFLPVTLVLAYITRRHPVRNFVLLILSIIFYIFGEGELIILMFSSIVMNYFLGRWIGRSTRKTPIVIGVTINLLVLVIYKYAGFVIENLNELLALFTSYRIQQVKIKLPAGISFYTFHCISYLIDVYRRTNKSQKAFVDLALYIMLFPQLIAGPIIRYKDVASQFVGRKLTSPMFQSGVERFIIGLGKKIVIANSLAIVADEAFGADASSLGMSMAWLGAICYALQLYFDFSAYSDMAIGLARMLGFSFLENFRFPYISQSIKEFWQRWHISLSNWFRDYVYIPLGGNRGGLKKTYINLYIVFALTGLWHGASWNFVIWGLAHGTFMVLERLGFERVLLRWPRWLRHFYALFVVVILWVFFRAEDLPSSIIFIKAMFGNGGLSDYTSILILDIELQIIFVCAIIMSVNGFNRSIRRIFRKLIVVSSSPVKIKAVFRGTRVTFLLLVMIYSTLIISTGSYNPFIYFRF